MSSPSVTNIQQFPVDPLCRLPNEVCSIIFVHCLPSNPSYHEHPRRGRDALRDPRLIPFALASVSRSWRAIACGTPELWSTCWVNFIIPEINRIWLERAGSRLLHLYGAYYKSSFISSEPFDFMPIFLGLLPYQKQWRALELDTRCVYLRLPAPHLDTPELEIFHMPACGSLPEWLESLLPNAPKLRSLELDTFDYYNWSRIPAQVKSQLGRHIPFLSTLTIEYASTHEVVLILSLLPQLLNLDVALVVDTPVIHLPPVTPFITHGNLEDLSIRNLWSVSDLFDHLTLPSLYSLYTEGCFSADSLLSLVERSHCTITELALNCFEIADEDIVSILQDSLIGPSLEVLKLRDYGGGYFQSNRNMNGFTPTLFEFLRYDSNNQCLPRLLELYFDFNEYRLKNIPEGLMAETIYSRCRKTLRDKIGSSDEIRATHLEYVHASSLDSATRALDVARLLPLPGDKPDSPEDAMTLIDLELSGSDLSPSVSLSIYI